MAWLLEVSIRFDNCMGVIASAPGGHEEGDGQIGYKSVIDRCAGHFLKKIKPGEHFYPQHW